MPTKVQVYQEVPGIDQRLGELQSQLDRLTVSLQLWRDQQEHAQRRADRVQLVGRLSEALERDALIEQLKRARVDGLETHGHFKCGARCVA